MAQPNDSIAATAGSGTTLATHLQSSKEFETVILADASGHILTAPNLYWFTMTAFSVHVAAASTNFLDLFNADATVKVRVRSIIHQIQPVVGGNTGTGIRWQILRTTAAGTGGTSLTAVKSDSSLAALDSDITARTNPSGGATAGESLLWYNRSSLEVTPAGPVNLGSPEVLPLLLVKKGILLGQNMGLRINQETNTDSGESQIRIGFTVE